MLFLPSVTHLFATTLSRAAALNPSTSAKMAFQWFLDSLPGLRQTAATQVRRVRSYSSKKQSERSQSQPKKLERVRGSRVTKSPSVKTTARKERNSKAESITPEKYIYTIPAFRDQRRSSFVDQQSELSTASIVTTPSASGKSSSIDSEERYLPKHKIKETLQEFDFDREAKIQRQQLLIKQHSGLTQLEVKLFNQISMVGLEPLLPLSWQHDFPTFPDPMFINTADPEAPMPFLCESRGSEYAGKST